MNYAEDRLDRKARYSNESSSDNSLYSDLVESHKLLKSKNLDELSKGHELCGRTLRDAGFCRQAVFHYAMVWSLNPSDQKAIGDYAQMAELAGFPEVSIICLQFFRLGGNAFVDDEESSYRVDEIKGNIFDLDEEINSNMNCGCGMQSCGTSLCFLPKSVYCSNLFADLVGAFSTMDKNLSSCTFMENEINAADLIEIASKANQKSNPVPPRLPICPDYIPFQLRFWMPDNRHLSPILQIMLLKLLYTSPVGHSFLLLACESIRHLCIQLPVSSLLGREMAKTHKSHLAYYVLIYKLVLGERVKKSRRGSVVPYHYPLWDIVHNLDARYIVHFNENAKYQTADYLAKLFHSLSSCISMVHSNLKLPITTNTIFAIGDSHVLSLAWQTIRIQFEGKDCFRTLIPCPITGLKAWHTRRGTKFFTHYNLHLCLRRLPPSCRTIILSAGEIDCREGIGGSLLEGYYKSCDDAVENTIQEFLANLNSVADEYNLQILIMPVAPHAYRSEKNGKSLGRGQRRQRMRLWNDLLRNFCSSSRCKTYNTNIFLLDYEEDLRAPDNSSPVGFVLNKHYNCDFTHMNSAFIPLLENALVKSGCETTLL
jgi:hypothetical protein